MRGRVPRSESRSHLHEDHIGGIPYLPGTEFIVADAEWQAMEQPWPELRGFLRKHIDLPGVRYRRIEFAPTHDPAVAPFTAAYDVMGDGSLLLLPTPGHTPGSMSLLVRRPGKPPLLLVGDLAILPAHDPGAAERLRRANGGAPQFSPFAARTARTRSPRCRSRRSTTPSRGPLACPRSRRRPARGSW